MEPILITRVGSGDGLQGQSLWLSIQSCNQSFANSLQSTAEACIYHDLVSNTEYYTVSKGNTYITGDSNAWRYYR